MSKAIFFLMILSMTVCGVENYRIFDRERPLSKTLTINGAEIIESGDDQFTLKVPVSNGWPQASLAVKIPAGRYETLKFRAMMEAPPECGWTFDCFDGDKTFGGGYQHQTKPDKDGYYNIALSKERNLTRLRIAFKMPQKEFKATFADFILVECEKEAFAGLENIAMGKEVFFAQHPNYPHCSGPSDTADLTDGRFLNNDREKIWMCRETVGWRMQSVVSFDIDLGKSEPVTGLRYHTGAGIAGVRFPLAIYVLAGNDLEHFSYIGELVGPNQKKLPEYNTRLTNLWLESGKLDVKARYFRFIVKCDGMFHFADEVEIFRGNADECRKIEELPRISGALEELVMLFSAAERLNRDCAMVKANARALGLQADRELDTLRKKIDADWNTWLHCTTTVAPLNKAQSELLALNGKILRQSGKKGMILWNGEVWTPFNIFSMPPEKVSVPMLKLYALQGERRSAILNFTNASEQAQEVELKASAGGAIQFYEAVCMDSKFNFLNSNMLRPATTLRIPSGASMQAWIEFDAAGIPSGIHTETISVGGKAIPVELHVGTFRMPEKFHSAFGTFDYLNNLPSAYPGITAENYPTAAKLIEKYRINTIWGSLPVIPWVDAGYFSDRDELVKKPDYRAFDAWCKRFAAADNLALFFYPAANGVFAGMDCRTEPEHFKKRLTAWLKDWLEHVTGRGLEPERFKLHFMDEAGDDAFRNLFLSWAEPVRQTRVNGHRFQVYFNPRMAPGDKRFYPEADVLSPAFEFTAESMKHYRKAAEQRKNGSFGLYLCNGNSRGLDPYTYYSLPQRCGILFPEFYGFDLWDFVTAPSDLNEYACDKLVFSPFYFDGKRIYGSKQVEAIYAGRQDYEYFLILKKLMAHFRVAAPETARQCEEQLKAVEAELMAEMKGPDTQYWDKPKTRETAERRRIEIWKLLESIAEKHPEIMERCK